MVRIILTKLFIGLQTPRLKRLAEIVSAQAIAQQEKLEFEPSLALNGDSHNSIYDEGMHRDLHQTMHNSMQHNYPTAT